ncbi:MAG: hypothetical protein ACD_46C00204G0001 [uncultured bacterium]|nr:MAG: hypothetical protein ACD_46C00204G0001 [uncultured bacterium]
MMSYDFWQSIASTSWWYFLIFSYVIFMGVLSTKTRVVEIKNNIFILPTLFFISTISTLIIAKQFTLKNAGIWAVGILIGYAISWLQLRFSKIRAIRNENKLKVPGSWNILMTLGIVLVVKYYTGYNFTFDIYAYDPTHLFFWLAGLYGLFSGLFLGKMIYCHRCIKFGPFVAE